MANNNVKLGTWAEIPTPYATDIISKAGLDFSIIDFEHGVIDFETAQNMIFAAHSNKKSAYIRVPAIEESWILRSLDMGCDGMIFPHVSSIEDINKITDLSYFAPDGNRGFNPYVTSGGYSNVEKGFFEQANSKLQLGIILEGEEGFSNIDSILNSKGINIVYIGQYDLSMALGIPGDVNNPKVISLLKETVKKIRDSEKMAGCMVHTAQEAKNFIDMGFDFVVYKVDSGLLYQIVNDFVKEIKL